MPYGRALAWIAVAVCACGLGGRPAQAQPDDAPPAGVPQPAPMDEGTPVEGGPVEGTPPTAPGDPVAAGAEAAAEILRLTLREALRMALDANLVLREQAFGAPMAYQSWIESDASFDRLLTAGFEASRIETPTTSQLFGNQIRNTTTSAFVGVSRQLRRGGSVSLLYQADRLDTTQLFTGINPAWTNTITAEVRHPLLRGKGAVNETDLRKAANGIAAAQANFETAAESILVAVAEAYWELAYAQHNLESLRKSENVALELLEDVRSRERAGVATPTDVAEASAGLERRRSDRIAASGARHDVSDQLLALIRPFQICEVSDLEIVAIDDLMQPDVRVAQGNQKSFVQMAVRGRPELRTLRADISNRGLDQVALRDAIRPQLDLVGRLGSIGLSGGFGDSLLDMSAGKNVTATLGVEFSVFLGQRAAKARWRAAGWARRQAVLRLREQENQIVLDVRRALRDARTAEAVLRASQAEVRASQESLDGELLRLREGKSTPFRTLQLDDDLSQARTRVARAAASARRAEARLWRAVGGLTKRHGGRLPRFADCRTCFRGR